MQYIAAITNPSQRAEIERWELRNTGCWAGLHAVCRLGWAQTDSHQTFSWCVNCFDFHIAYCLSAFTSITMSVSSFTKLKKKLKLLWNSWKYPGSSSSQFSTSAAELLEFAQLGFMGQASAGSLLCVFKNCTLSEMRPWKADPRLSIAITTITHWCWEPKVRV